MSEIFTASPDKEPTSKDPLDKDRILFRLFQVAEVLGLDVADVDVKYLIGQDDNDFLGNLTTLAVTSGVDLEELFDLLGIVVEHGGQTE